MSVSVQDQYLGGLQLPTDVDLDSDCSAYALIPASGDGGISGGQKPQRHWENSICSLSYLNGREVLVVFNSSLRLLRNSDKIARQCIFQLIGPAQKSKLQSNLAGWSWWYGVTFCKLWKVWHFLLIELDFNLNCHSEWLCHYYTLLLVTFIAEITTCYHNF